MLTLARAAMRTRFEIVLADDDDPARLRAAGEEALDEIERVEAQLSAYRSSSDLSFVNARAAAGPVPVPPPFFRFLERAAALCRATDGAFDPTIAPLLRCWGFSEPGETPVVPAEDAIAEARARVGMAEMVHLDPEAGTVAFARSGVRLDPGAIGKGCALERAADLLRDAGIASALLHGGTSTVYALGAPPGEAGWKVAVQDPTQAGRRLATVTLRDCALSVSGVHGKSFWAGGRRFGHVIDPRTGWPVRDSIVAAVAAASPTDTDALSTGLLVGGTGGLTALAGRYPEAGLLLACAETESSRLRIARAGDAFILGEENRVHE